MAGVSGTTIGQWARWGYIRSSLSQDEPRVYSVEDVAEAAVVRALLERGIRHAEIRRALAHLERYGTWPLSQAPLATTRDGPRAHLVLRDDDGVYALTSRGWQLMGAPPRLAEVRLRLASAAPVRSAGDGGQPSTVE